MIVGFEISKPFQLKPKLEKKFPGFYFMWGWFAFWLAKESLGLNLIEFHVCKIRYELDKSRTGVKMYYDMVKYPNGIKNVTFEAEPFDGDNKDLIS